MTDRRLQGVRIASMGSRDAEANVLDQVGLWNNVQPML